MALFYMIRHGEPDYKKAEDAGFYGFGFDFAPLTELGVQQAEETALDERLRSAQIIVSSPFTRALQTAAIISRVTQIPIVVEEEIHEWIPDWTNSYHSGKEVEPWAQAFQRNRGEHPQGENYCWETASAIQKRVLPVMEKYADHEKVIVVAHGMAIQSVTHYEDLHFAEIIEWRYEKGQKITPYFEKQ